MRCPRKSVMPEERPQIVLGFDFGIKRIGVAVGQTFTSTATPVGTLVADAGVPNWNDVAGWIHTWQADLLIVGVPFNMDGTEQGLTHKVRQFAQELRQRFHLPVFLVDERLTTIESKQQLYKQHGFRNKDIDKMVDGYAAKLIVEQWLALPRDRRERI